MRKGGNAKSKRRRGNIKVKIGHWVASNWIQYTTEQQVTVNIIGSYTRSVALM